MVGKEIHQFRTQWQESYVCGNIHKHWRSSDCVILQHCQWTPHSFIPNRTLFWCALWWLTSGQNECEMEGGEMFDTGTYPGKLSWAQAVQSSVLSCRINHPSKHIYFIIPWWSKCQLVHSSAGNLTFPLFCKTVWWAAIFLVKPYFPQNLCLNCETFSWWNVDGITFFSCKFARMFACVRLERRKEKNNEKKDCLNRLVKELYGTRS